MSKPEFQYVTELHDHDVVLGRGSGPNDRTGNINFRLLCQEKKIAYIEATSRDEKGRIAADIVATVHNRGGRFLKRLTAEQAKKTNVDLRGADAVYELADKQTILEKTKQTLRQNRADFVAKVQKEGGRAPVVGAYPIHQRKNNGDSDEKMDKIQMTDEVKSNPNGALTSEDDTVNNLDPIPLGESCGLLDSMNCPAMGKNSATLLLKALFSSSDILSNNSAQSDVSAMSIQDMSAILRDALDKRSSGTEMNSANLCQSILNVANTNEHMADQLVQELVKDNKTQQGSSSFTGQQKALLLQYEQNQQRVQGQQQVQDGGQQSAQHPFGQYRLEDDDNDNSVPNSVFSSLVRQYGDDDGLNQSPSPNQDCFGRDGDVTPQRGHATRTTLSEEEQIEPANYMNESMDISCGAANLLHKALGGSDDNGLNQSPSSNQDCFGRDGDVTPQRGHATRTTLAEEEQIEPANYMNESMDLSYGAANLLHKALGGSSLTSVFEPDNSREPSSSTSGKSRKCRNSMDSTIKEFNDSLMSMSISELDRPGHSASSPKRGAPDEVNVKRRSSRSVMSNSLRVSDLIIDTEEDLNC